MCLSFWVRVNREGQTQEGTCKRRAYHFNLEKCLEIVNVICIGTWILNVNSSKIAVESWIVLCFLCFLPSPLPPSPSLPQFLPFLGLRKKSPGRHYFLMSK